MIGSVATPSALSVGDQRVDHLLSIIQPESTSELHRLTISSYICNLIKQCFSSDRKVEVFLFGSVPLRTYLSDGDIDISMFSLPKGPNDNIKDVWANKLVKHLEREQALQLAPFRIRSCQIIQAEVKLVKCIVGDIVVDISFNTLGGVCAVAFLEWIDRKVGRDHLFKRSIVLVKAWCYYESRLLGAHHGLISSYALETMVLYVLNIHGHPLESPLQVLQKFLEVLASFGWDKYCMSMMGPIPLSSFPYPYVDKTALPSMAPLLDDDDVRHAAKEFSVQPAAAIAMVEQLLSGKTPPPSTSQQQQQNQQQRLEVNFPLKHLNLMDPLLPSNNLGRSVSRASYARVHKAFKYASQSLNSILAKDSIAAGEAFEQFFRNTWRSHATKRIHHPPAPTAHIATPPTPIDGFNIIPAAGHGTIPHNSQSRGVVPSNIMPPPPLLAPQGLVPINPNAFNAAAAHSNFQHTHHLQHQSGSSSTKAAAGSDTSSLQSANSLPRRHSDPSLPEQFIGHQLGPLPPGAAPGAMWVPINHPHAALNSSGGGGGHGRRVQGFPILQGPYLAHLPVPPPSAHTVGNHNRNHLVGTRSSPHHSRGASFDSMHSSSTPGVLSQPASPMPPSHLGTMMPIAALHQMHGNAPSTSSGTSVSRGQQSQQHHRRPSSSISDDTNIPFIDHQHLHGGSSGSSMQSWQQRWLSDLAHLEPPSNPGVLAPVTEPALSSRSMWSSDLDTLARNMIDARQCHVDVRSGNTFTAAAAAGNGNTTTHQHQDGSSISSNKGVAAAINESSSNGEQQTEGARLGRPIVITSSGRSSIDADGGGKTTTSSAAPARKQETAHIDHKQQSQAPSSPDGAAQKINIASADDYPALGPATSTSSSMARNPKAPSAAAANTVNYAAIATGRAPSTKKQPPPTKAAEPTTDALIDSGAHSAKTNARIPRTVVSAAPASAPSSYAAIATLATSPKKGGGAGNFNNAIHPTSPRALGPALDASHPTSMRTIGTLSSRAQHTQHQMNQPSSPGAPAGGGVPLVAAPKAAAWGGVAIPLSSGKPPSSHQDGVHNTAAAEATPISPTAGGSVGSTTTTTSSWSAIASRPRVQVAKQLATVDTTTSSSTPTKGSRSRPSSAGVSPKAPAGRCAADAAEHHGENGKQRAAGFNLATQEFPSLGGVTGGGSPKKGSRKK